MRPVGPCPPQAIPDRVGPDTESQTVVRSRMKPYGTVSVVLAQQPQSRKSHAKRYTHSPVAL